MADLKRQIQIYKKIIPCTATQPTREIPEIKISGFWLLHIGWKPGQKVTITEQGNSLIITKI